MKTRIGILATATLGLILVSGGCSRSQPKPAGQVNQPPATQPVSQPAKEFALDLGNKVTMKLVLIPAGKFMMGSPEEEKGRNSYEGPQHEVTIMKPFYLGVYAVTQQQWKSVMDTEPWKDKAGAKEGADNPATEVGWRDSVEFCKKMSQKVGKSVRLPTEAEREYASRAGTATQFHFGDIDIHSRSGYLKFLEYGWCGLCDWDVSDRHAQPVGQKKPNAWGLYDIYGNVYEWCADWYGAYKKLPEIDPQGPKTGEYHVLRGGGWASDISDCRSASRAPGIGSGGDHSSYVGFRVVVDLK